MNNQFYECHYAISQYIEFLFCHSQIVDIEINIANQQMYDDWDEVFNPCIFLIYVSFYGSEENPFKLIDWVESPELSLSIHSYDKINYLYSTNKINSYDFIFDLFKKFPLLNDQKFLLYLKEQMHQDGDSVGFQRFYSYSLGNDLNNFISSNLKSYFLFSKLNNKINNENTQNILISKNKI